MTTKTLTAQAERVFRRQFHREVSHTYAANKTVHDGLFEAAYFEGMEDDLLDFLAKVEEQTGVKFDFTVKSARVRIGYAGSYI